jgi:hypothetical protein
MHPRAGLGVVAEPASKAAWGNDEEGRMSRVKKSSLARTTDRAAASYLNKLSKAALIDVVIDLLRQDGTASCDDPVTVDRVLAVAAAVLAMRGDPVPRPPLAGASR